METICKMECVLDPRLEDICGALSDTSPCYMCTRSEGHEGSHSACGLDEHDLQVWGEDVVEEVESIVSIVEYLESLLKEVVEESKKKKMSETYRLLLIGRASGIRMSIRIIEKGCE